MMTGIIFDLDGTLLDTLEDLADSVNYVLRENGCPERSLGQIRAMVGNGVRNLILQALPPEKKGQVDQILPAFRAYYGAHSQIKTRPYEGVLEALEEICREFPVAVVSNKPDPAVKALCDDYFSGVFALGERADCPRKPAPDMLYKAMEHLGVDKAVYVGDSEVDVITAQNAGVPCLSVLWGFRDKADMEAVGGTHFCEKTEDLVAKLEELIG